MSAVRRHLDRVLDQLLRAVGLGVWLVAGSPSWTAPRSVAHPVVWAALYLAFAACFLGATASEATLARRRSLVAAEAALAIALALAGMPHFEGALFAVVSAQVPSLTRPALALVWDAASGAALFAIVLPSHGVLGGAKATGEYVAFALFALAVVYLRAREAAARDELARAHAIVLGTQALLADDARTAERLRIAREVHDAIGHGLSAASIHLQLAARTCEGCAATASIAAARDAVSATLAEVRGLVGAMREPEGIDLGTALRAMCAGIREPAVHLAIAAPLRVEDPARAHALFRCTQEALTNALRHARASEIWVDVTGDDAGIAATVRDDGVGAGALAHGNGLDGLRERLAEVAGTLHIETRPRGGFMLRAWVPRREARP